MKLAMAWLTAVAALGAQSPVPAETPERFVAELRRALAADDRQAVASLVQFPANVWAGGFRLPMPDAQALLAQYDAIFTSGMKTILASGVVERRAPDVLTLGGGAIEAAQVDGRLRITRISVLTAPREVDGATASSAAGAPTSAGAGGAGAATRQTRRLTFRAGQRSAQWADTVGARETDSYVVFIAQGQMLDVRLDRVRGRDVVVTVADAKTGKPIDAKAGAGVRTWTGRVPAAADYRIDVSRTIPDSEPPLPYTLTVSFK